MLPWNYGFHWTAGTIVFLGVFYTVLVIIAVTVARACVRARRDFRQHKLEAVRWHAEFEELPERDRACRHELTGKFRRKTCQNAFDCRACELHTNLAARADKSSRCETEIFGLEFPPDRCYHRGHTWARQESDGTITVGLDDLGRRLIGNPDEMELPPPGAAVRVNGAAWRMKKGAAEVRVLSPVEGHVVAAGGPEQGWYLKVKPSGTPNLAHLLQGAEVRPWVMRELERLQLMLGPAGAAPSLADGGVPVEDMGQAYRGPEWDAARAEMFLQP